MKPRRWALPTRTALWPETELHVTGCDTQHYFSDRAAANRIVGIGNAVTGLRNYRRPGRQIGGARPEAERKPIARRTNECGLAADRPGAEE